MPNGLVDMVQVLPTTLLESQPPLSSKLHNYVVASLTLAVIPVEHPKANIRIVIIHMICFIGHLSLSNSAVLFFGSTN